MQLKAKTKEISQCLSTMGKAICAGDDSTLFVWVIPGKLACTHRPLRHHPEYGGSRRDLPRHATGAVIDWVKRVRRCGIKSIICLMHSKELRHYDSLDLDAPDIVEFYRQRGLQVCHIPWDDPVHRPLQSQVSFKDELLRVRQEALTAFDTLPDPILLHCSAGIDRSAPVAAYIWRERPD